MNCLCSFFALSNIGGSGGLLFMEQRSCRPGEHNCPQAFHHNQRQIVIWSWLWVSQYLWFELSSRSQSYLGRVDLNQNFYAISVACWRGYYEILSISERTGCDRVDRGMRDLLEFINKLELQNLPMMGIRFTWANFQDSAIHSRIDRFLVSIEWIQKLKPNQWGLPRSISDHCPIMIAEDSRDWGPKPFRFMDAW